MSGNHTPATGFSGPFVAALVALCLATSGGTQELPQTIPAPEFREDQPGPGDPAAVPLPETRPQGGAKTEKPRPATPVGPGTAPSAAERPSPIPPPIATDPRSAMRPDPSGTLPAPEAACRRRLASLGATFGEEGARFDAQAGCSVPYPLMLRSFGHGIELEPAAEMSCAMAEAASRFIQEVAAPAARTVFASELKSVSQASAYVCRRRNGGGKLSEHAFGNALDIAAFTLADGTSIKIEPRPETERAFFLGRLRRAACGIFSTVLGPGSDADHATHLHVDLQPRKSGRSFCR